MKIRVFILIVAAAFMLSSCGKTPESDIDIIVFGGDGFKKTNIFAFAEELRTATGKDVDAFEICEVNSDSEFYRNAVNEGIKIA